MARFPNLKSKTSSSTTDHEEKGWKYDKLDQTAEDVDVDVDGVEDVGTGSELEAAMESATRGRASLEDPMV